MYIALPPKLENLSSDPYSKLGLFMPITPVLEGDPWVYLPVNVAKFELVIFRSSEAFCLTNKVMNI